MTTILMPLVFTSLDRIDVITNAMELRGFGKGKKRTWYKTRKLRNADYIMIVVSILAIMISISLYAINDGRFYNPFRKL